MSCDVTQLGNRGQSTKQSISAVGGMDWMGGPFDTPRGVLDSPFPVRGMLDV